MIKQLYGVLMALFCLCYIGSCNAMDKKRKANALVGLKTPKNKLMACFYACGRKFKKEEIQSLHEQHWCRKNPYIVKCYCECGEGPFKAYDEFREHKKSHLETYMCDWCGYAFKSEEDLQHHEEEGCKNRETNTYRCARCGKHDIISQQGFSAHMQTHSNLYPCIFCREKFEDLKLHQETCLVLKLEMRKEKEKTDLLLKEFEQFIDGCNFPN